MAKQLARFFIVGLMVLALGACVGARTFHEYARAGDTVAVATGWQKNFSRNNITVTITPSAGVPIVYAPNDPAVRAVVNLYPDPVSSLIVSTETGQDLTPYAQTYGSMVTGNLTKGEKDWYQSTVFIDLPATLPTGTTTIAISNNVGDSTSSTVDIVPGVGSPNTFYTSFGPLNSNQLASMERVAHYTISFSATTIPYAIQVDLSHSPDVDHGGTGRAYVVNPRGDLKNISWSDTGTSTRIIIMPAKGQALSTIKDYKFYVAGGVANLALVGVKAVDINGVPVAGVTAAVN